jgi:hypothetical protein
MDFIYLAGAIVMLIAMLAMVVGCDKLGVHK